MRTKNVRPETEPEELVRLPGLFRRWEIEQVIDDSADTFRVEPVGKAPDGSALFAVYRRDQTEGGES